MIRAVVDTNIFIRAIIRPRGTVAPMLTRLQEGAYELIVSDPLLDELMSILTLPRIRDKYHLSKEDIQAVLAFIS
jgi:predicted nucleic acid-binding protein